jgi:hypothetical protein
MSTPQDQLVNLPVLNLPPIQPVLRQAEGKLWIFDALRKKHLVLTPEEWVRQHWIHYLIEHHHYPGGLFSLEKGLKYHQMQKRTDLVVFDRMGSPFLLVECKAPAVAINDQTLRQALIYNQSLDSPHLILSNGVNHFFMSFDPIEKKYTQRHSLPSLPKI